MRESEIIERIRAAFPGAGIGDDAAVLPPCAGELLFASDAVVENVHFSRRYSTLGQAVQKVITSNVSDIYAMGGSPAAITLTMGLPSGCGDDDVESIIEGLSLACETYGLALAGGDTVRSPGGSFFDVAVAGAVTPGKAVPRSGAREGDAIVLFGDIGPSLAGLSLLTAFLGACGCGGGNPPSPRLRDCAAAGARIRGIAPRLSLALDAASLKTMAAGLAHLPHAPEMLRFMWRHLAPRAAPLEAALLDAEPRPVTAMIDVSDGLARDLRTLCAMSRVGAVIDAEALPIPRAIGDVFGLEGAALVDFVLSSGEEYVLLASVAPEALATLPKGAAVIGRIAPERDGLLLTGSGISRPLPPLGYEHAF